MNIGRAKKGFGLLAIVLGMVGACSERVATSGGSETNWLGMCNKDSDCSAGHCLCGICTESCSDASSCPSGSGLDTCASSSAAAISALCDGEHTLPSGVCLKGCGKGESCGKGFTCESGACVPSVVVGPDAGSGGATGSGGGATGSGGKHDGAGGTTSAGPTPTTNEVFADTILVEQQTSTEQLTGKCLPRPLALDGNGQVPCSVIVFENNPPSCGCSDPGERKLTSDELSAALTTFREHGGCDTSSTPACNSLCGCGMLQESGDALTKCQSSTDVQGVMPGFCYVDPAASPGASPSLVADCSSTQKRILRFVGSIPNNVKLLLACSVATPHPDEPAVSSPGNIGDPCILGDEYDPNFSGFSETEINVETGSPACQSAVCLAYDFRGRVSCPIGQEAAAAPDPVTGMVAADPNLPIDKRCFLPGASHTPDNLIDVPVDAQLVGRQPYKSVYCSCRCDGPAGTGPFCACPSGFECKSLIDGLSSSSDAAGSYCIKAGTEVSDPAQLTNTTKCSDLPPSIQSQPPPMGCGNASPPPDGG
ncbi:MAG TPA: hypothetical protein VHC69_34210 [Polyangiaceae bacterium]|nr:hypothetical protein [Polyangiaceae bacterium]